jgi:hypothetical protein
MSQGLALQQGESLQKASVNSFRKNIISPLKMHFPLLNHTELCHRVSCIVLLPGNTF